MFSHPLHRRHSIGSVQTLGVINNLIVCANKSPLWKHAINRAEILRGKNLRIQWLIHFVNAEMKLNILSVGSVNNRAVRGIQGVLPHTHASGRMVNLSEGRIARHME